MLNRVTELILHTVPVGLASFFVGVVAGFVFLLLNPRDRLRAYLSNVAVRRFVEYFGNIGLGDDGTMVSHHKSDQRRKLRVARRA